ncbi:MAG: hypothetical protein KKG93_15750, partial [Bacteroidetes bacterium]|nr:hypothetical protein [Bacteroidota bacterium]
MIKSKIYIMLFFCFFVESTILAQNDWQFLGLENLTIEHVYAKGDTIWVGTLDSMYQRDIYYSFTGGE